MNTIQVEVVSAEESIFSGQAEFVVLPGESGELGVYAGHTPLITRIKAGAVRIKLPDAPKDELIFVAGGILEIQPDVITVLADTAIRGADLDEARAEEARRNAQDAINKAKNQRDLARAQAEFALLTAQMNTIRRYR